MMQSIGNKVATAICARNANTDVCQMSNMANIAVENEKSNQTSPESESDAESESDIALERKQKRPASPKAKRRLIFDERQC